MLALNMQLSRHNAMPSCCTIRPCPSHGTIGKQALQTCVAVQDKRMPQFKPSIVLERLDEMGLEGGIFDFTGDEDAQATIRDFTLLPRLQARIKLSSIIAMRTVALSLISSLLFFRYSFMAMYWSQ
jgi:hypothetical protein